MNLLDLDIFATILLCPYHISRFVASMDPLSRVDAFMLVGR
jgi:hypothetical protein